MAAADLGELTGLIDAIGAVKGKKTKRTEQTNVSDAGVSEIVNNILAGPGGVRTIGSAARKSGLYNDTVSEDRLGDLYAKAAVNAELARSPTTVTTETPGVGLGSTIGTLAATSALSSLMKGEVPFAGMFGGGGGAAATAAGGAPIVEAVPLAGGGSSALSASMPTLAEELGQVGTAAVSTPTVASGAVSGLSTGASAGTAAVQQGGGLLSSAGNFVGNNLLGLGAPLLGGLLAGDDADDPLSLALSAGAGFLSMGPVGLIAAPVSTLLGGLLGDSGIGGAISDAFSDIGDFFSDLF
jgi:hypothetical protein